MTIKNHIFQCLAITGAALVSISAGAQEQKPLVGSVKAEYEAAQPLTAEIKDQDVLAFEVQNSFKLSRVRGILSDWEGVAVFKDGSLIPVTTKEFRTIDDPSNRMMAPEFLQGKIKPPYCYLEVFKPDLSQPIATGKLFNVNASRFNSVYPFLSVPLTDVVRTLGMRAFDGGTKEAPLGPPPADDNQKGLVHMLSAPAKFACVKSGPSGGKITITSSTNLSAEQAAKIDQAYADYAAHPVSRSFTAAEIQRQVGNYIKVRFAAQPAQSDEDTDNTPTREPSASSKVH